MRREPLAFQARAFTQPWWPCTALAHLQLRPQHYKKGSAVFCSSIYEPLAIWGLICSRCSRCIEYKYCQSTSNSCGHQCLLSTRKEGNCIVLLTSSMPDVIYSMKKLINCRKYKLNLLPTSITFSRSNRWTREECICSARIEYGCITGNGTCDQRSTKQSLALAWYNNQQLTKLNICH